MATFKDTYDVLCNGTPDPIYLTHDKCELIRYYITLENEIELFNDITEDMYDGVNVSITQINQDLTTSVITMNEGEYLQRADWVKQIYPIYQYIKDKIMQLMLWDEFFELYKVLLVEYNIYIAELKIAIK